MSKHDSIYISYIIAYILSITCHIIILCVIYFPYPFPISFDCVMM